MKDLTESKRHSGYLRPFLNRLPPGHEFDSEDKAALRMLAKHARAFPDKHVFKRYEQYEPDTVLLLDGVALRVRITKNGDRRILGFLLPGELSTLPNGARRANYELVAQGPCIAVILPRRELAALEKRHTNIRRYLEWNAQNEIRSLQDRFVAMAGARVEDKLMYLLEDIYARLSEIEQTEGRTMSLPVRQHDIADAIGSSLVQVSKTLSRLRREGRIKLQVGTSETTFSLPED